MQHLRARYILHQKLKRLALCCDKRRYLICWDLTKKRVQVVYEIYVDGKDPIKISITGKAEYDKQLFQRQILASLQAIPMTLIDRKYSFGGDPEIYIKATDDKGIIKDV